MVKRFEPWDVITGMHAEARLEKDGRFVEYTDYAELAAEVERLKQEVENWKTSAAGWQKIANVDAEALSRAGAVKVSREDVAKLVYEAMSWAAMCGPTPNGIVPVWEDRGNSLGQEEARRIADRILSALEPAAQVAPANLAEDDVDAAYQAALDNLPAEFHGEIGRGELDRMVRAIVKAHDSKWERRAKAMAHHHHSALQASIVAIARRVLEGGEANG